MPTATTVTFIANYLIYIGLAAVLLLLFFVVYTWVTPFDEFLLIRQGNSAAALSLGGAVVGFSMTIASSIFHTNTVLSFCAWGLGAMLLQILAYMVTCRMLSMSKEQIESGNTAFGGLLGAISLSVGAINAACIS